MDFDALTRRYQLRWNHRYSLHPQGSHQYLALGSEGDTLEPAVSSSQTALRESASTCLFGHYTCFRGHVIDWVGRRYNTELQNVQTNMHYGTIITFIKIGATDVTLCATFGCRILERTREIVVCVRSFICVDSLFAIRFTGFVTRLYVLNSFGGHLFWRVVRAVGLKYCRLAG